VFTRGCGARDITDLIYGVSALLLFLINRINPLWPMHFPRSWHIATES
jgi:hypothetical protein